MIDSYETPDITVLGTSLEMTLSGNDIGFDGLFPTLLDCSKGTDFLCA